MVQVAVTNAMQDILGSRVLRTVTVKRVSAVCSGFGFQVSLEAPL